MRHAFCVLLLCSPALADRPGIEATLREMESAVVTGDSAAYMKFVHSGDSTFVKEQENWIKDAGKNKPSSFKFSIVDDGPEALAPDWDGPSVTFTLKMTWKMDEKARERVVKYPVTFARVGGAWQYKGERWEETIAPADPATGFAGVRVLYPAGEERLQKYADAVVKVMPEVRSAVDTHFRLVVPGVQTVKLYGSMKHLQASIWLAYDQPLGGWNEPGESIKVLPAGRTNEDAIKSLLAHEYGHVATFVLGGKATDAPWWALEGAAELAAAEFRPKAAERRNGMVERWAKQEKLAKWEDISPFPLKDKSLEAQVYTQGEHMLAFINDKYGPAKRIAFLKALCEGATMEEASKGAIGVPWSKVNEAWRAGLPQKPTPQDPRINPNLG